MTTNEAEVQRWVAATNAALARNATLLAEPPSPARLESLMRQYGGRGASAAKPANELGQAKPWREVLHSLAIGGGAAAVIEAKSVQKISTEALPPKPNSLPKESTPSYSPNVSGDTVGAARPWSQVLREVEPEGAR